MKKLENNVLEGVNIGDNLVLKAKNGDFVSGFVTKMTPGKVKLSLEYPTNKSYYTGFFRTEGQRAYWLNRFAEYDVKSFPIDNVSNSGSD